MRSLLALLRLAIAFPVIAVGALLIIAAAPRPCSPQRHPPLGLDRHAEAHKAIAAALEVPSQMT